MLWRIEKEKKNRKRKMVLNEFSTFLVTIASLWIVVFLVIYQITKKKKTKVLSNSPK